MIRIGFLLCASMMVAAGAFAPARAQSAAPAVRHFLFVATNDEDAAKLGQWPLNRGVYAAAIARARAGGAKAVILKFFYDLPSVPEADAKLARAIASMPVYLQYAFASGDGKAEGPPVWRSDFAGANVRASFKGGTPSQLPIPMFRQHAAGLGFVNVLPDPTYNQIEILGSTGAGGVAASLQFLSIEAGLGAKVSARKMQLNVNGKSYKIGSDGRVRCPYPEAGRPTIYSLYAFLHGQIPSNELRGRVVLIGNTRKWTPRLPISKTTNIPIHELFFRQVDCLDGLR